MNKSRFLSIISQKSGVSVQKLQKIYQISQNFLCEVLNKGESVSIKGFGKFWVKDLPARGAINPVTKRFYMTKAKKVTVFKSYKKLKYCVN